MRLFAVMTLVLIVPAMAAAQSVPCFFMDFDADGVSDYTEFVDVVNLGFFEPATLYIGVCWPYHCDPDNNIGLAAAEYQILYAGMVAPTVAAYAEPGAPTWALTIGTLVNGGGWFQSGPCRDACSGEFITALGVTGTGSLQTFDFAPTSAPYEFPGLFQIYDCGGAAGGEPVPYTAGARNNAAANGVPNAVYGVDPCACPGDCSAAAPSTWGSLKAMLK